MSGKQTSSRSSRQYQEIESKLLENMLKNMFVQFAYLMGEGENVDPKTRKWLVHAGGLLFFLLQEFLSLQVVPSKVSASKGPGIYQRSKTSQEIIIWNREISSWLRGQNKRRR